jgi:hypothetical protein
MSRRRNIVRPPSVVQRTLLTRQGGGRGGGQPFYPNFLPNLAVWSRYGVGITVTGAGVSSWADQSGNARDLLQGTDGNRPALQSDGSILFDGTDNVLATAGFSLAQPYTLYFLLRQVTWTSGDIIWEGVAESSLVNQAGTTPEIRLDGGAGAVAGNTNLVLGSYAALCIVFNGAASLIQVNDTAPTTGDGGTGAANGTAIGAVPSSGANASNIQVKEHIVYAAAHNGSERQNVISYLTRLGL